MQTKRLITTVVGFISVLCLIQFAQAQQAAPATTSKLLELTIPAPSLKGNLLGDPTEQPIYVYLPPSYESATAKRYPSVYLLHGFLGRSRVWVTGVYQGMNLQTMMDQLIKDGKVREMIVVAANGSNAYGGSFYTNSPVTGNWEDFVVGDLVNYVDSTYRTIARAESRGIAGHSMGGYGAVMLGMKHPEKFTALYALSPCCLVLDSDMSESNQSWLSVNRFKARTDLKTRPEGFGDFFNLVFV